MELTYRTPLPEEAPLVWSMLNALDRETRYMLYEPGERRPDYSLVEQRILRAQKDDFFCCAWAGKEPVACVSADRGMARRIRHSAYVVAGVREKWRHQGIGTELFRRMEAWARGHGVTRLELTVVAENDAAIGLYEKNGFEREGVKQQSILLDGEYKDELYMAKLLG